MNPLVFTHPLSAILTITIPLVIGITLIRKFKISWSVWWIGGFTFIISQVGHIPFNIAVDIMFERGWLPVPPPNFALGFSAIFLGLSAGLWEEWFRWIAYKWWVPKARSWKSGIVLGAGHGGMEAILIGFLSLATYINIIVLKGKDLTTMVPVDQLQIVQSQLESYWSLPWHYPFLGPIERLFTIPFHITASVLVLQAFTRGKIRWVWLSIAWHTILNAFVAVYLPALLKNYTWWPYAVEGVMGLTAIFNIGLLLKLKEPDPDPIPPEEPTNPNIPLTKISPPTTTEENLNNTRYQNEM